MKKTFTLSAATLATTLLMAGCTNPPPTSQMINQTEDQTQQTNSTASITILPATTQAEVVSSKITPEENIVETEDYNYDQSNGKLISLKNKQVIYTLKDYEEKSLIILGLQKNKLIVWETLPDNSPGPGWTYEIWFSATEAKNIKYLDLNNPAEGLQPYTIAEWKKADAQVQLEAFNKAEGIN